MAPLAASPLRAPSGFERPHSRRCEQCGTDFNGRPGQRLCSRRCRADSNRKPASRLWDGVEQRGPDDCWPWRGARTPKGYGRFGTAGYAHRIAWELTHGPIPAGLCVLHRCDNPPCCNPAHLWLGTIADNQADMAAKGRGRNAGKRGEECGSAKLTEADVREMRRLRANGMILREIAARFPVTLDNVHRVVTRKTWRHV